MFLHTDIIKDASITVQGIYNSHPSGNERFSRVIKLVQQCNTIGVQAELTKDELLMTQLAAFFLFSGWQSENGMIASVQHAENFLKSKEADADQILVIREAMLSITPPQLPMSAIAQVLCDSLNSFFVERTRELQVDLPEDILALLGDKRLGTDFKQQLNFLSHLKFFAPASQKLFEKPLKKKINWLLEKIGPEKEIDESGNPGLTGHIPYEGYSVDGDKPALARGIETMFRIASREHSSLLGIVHQKAGFLASINAIILSVIISVLSTKLQDNMHLMIPTCMLMLTCLGTIYFAVVATRPITINKPTGDFNHTNQNIMFFGHYTHIEWKAYCDELKKISINSNDLFETLSKNIYYQGHVLRKKYNILATGYNYFIGGLAASVIAFIISFFTVM